IPGTINAVDYDKGTQGDAYNIQQPASSGVYRTDDANGPVPLNSINQYGAATGTIVGGNGYVVGNHIVQGDYLVYTVNVATTGYYDIQVNAAPAQAGRQVDFQLDGTDVTPGNITLAYTSSWGNFGVATYASAHLTSGTHTLKMLVADQNAIFVLNTFTFTPHVVHSYYVSSSSGNDGNPGTQSSPFATVAKAESLTLNAGDSVFFLRGDTWREVLNPLSSGAVGNPITFADYGNAGNAKPKFWGSNQIAVNDGQWVSQGGNVYTHPYAQQVNSVLVNQQFLIDIFNGGTGDGSVVRDPSGTPNCWKWSGGTLTISTNGTNPNSDGRQYDVCVRDNVICNGSQASSNYSSNLVFRNLVVDECGSNANPSLGYGLRIEGDGVTTGINVLVDSCEVYRYGRHGFAVIDGSNVTFNSCYCAYPMPNVQTGQTGYVSFGNTGPNLSETSVYNNCTAEHQADTWNGRGDFEYEAFTDHGGSLKSVTLNNFRAIDTNGDGTGDNCTFDGASGAVVTVTGGTCYSAQVNTLGPNVVVNGMNITGPYASMDISGSSNIVENCIVAGTIYAAPYNSTIWIRGDSNIFRFNTVATDPSTGTGFTALCLASLGSTYGTNAQVYGNVLLANQLSINSFTSSNSLSAANVRDNVYTNGATFQLNYGAVWNLAQWQAQGYDAGSIQVANPDAALFTNAAGGDFSLKSGSAAIDLVPTSVPHPATDILGNGRPHGNADDSGAYEYGGTSSAVPVITSAGTASGTAGTAFSYQISATNSPTSFSASGLPAGVTVNTSTGLLSGTPTTAGTYSATINAINATGTGSGALSITIAAAAPPAPVINSATSATGTAGKAFSYQITATNTPTSFGATGLPAGLSVSASGLITGTPTAAGTSSVSLSATNAGGTGKATLTLTISAAAVTESPYGGTAWAIPGQVEAENYDVGGEGVAYHDSDSQNQGGAYRSDGVDIRAITSDAGGGYQVGWTNQGEYLNYTVNVTAAGTYQFQARVASGTSVGSSGGSLHFSVDGTNVTGAMAVPGTGSYDTFTTIKSGSVTLTAGPHVIQLFEEADNGYDLNWFSVKSVGPSYQINASGSAVSPFVADEFFTSAGTGMSSTGSTITTAGVANAAPAAVYQTARYGGDVIYTVPNLPVGASYHVRLHFAETYWTAAGQREFNIIINGVQALTNFDIFADAGATNKADVKDFNTTVNSSGQIVLQLHATVDNAQIAGLEITPN
ncbi:MAG: carbohydrate-binding protein, partial [Janthinobacterium lividum]